MLSVLSGDKANAKGPVLESNENSKIFFYFADHGAPGLVAMPVGPYLYAKDLMNTFKQMNQDKMYKEMTVYIEACESGSMFEGLLPDDINIYGVSASNSKQSSYASYCAPDDKVDGVGLNTCLGDLFSTNWMEDSDSHKPAKETLQTQYTTVQKETTMSPVLQWGDLKITSEPIGDFQGGKFDSVSKPKFWEQLKSFGKEVLKDAVKYDATKSVRKNQFAIDSRDVKLHYLYNRVISEPTPEAYKELAEEVENRMRADKIFKELFPRFKVGQHPMPTDYDCYKELIEHFEASCFKFDDYSMKYMGSLVQQCEAMKVFPGAKAEVMTKITETCAAKTLI